jgi:hypothetical protein
MTKRKAKDLIPVDNKISNGSKLVISQETAEEIVSGVLHEKKGGRQEKYFLYRILGLPPRISASLCNFNQDYGYKLDRKFREDLNLRARISKITGSIPEQYENLCKLRLVDVAEIDGKALAEYRNDPKLAIQKPQLLKQIKQAAKVLADDDKPTTVFVNIEKMQAIMRGCHEKPVTGLPEE